MAGGQASIHGSHREISIDAVDTVDTVDTVDAEEVLNIGFDISLKRDRL